MWKRSLIIWQHEFWLNHLCITCFTTSVGISVIAIQTDVQLIFAYVNYYLISYTILTMLIFYLILSITSIVDCTSDNHSVMWLALDHSIMKLIDRNANMIQQTRAIKTISSYCWIATASLLGTSDNTKSIISNSITAFKLIQNNPLLTWYFPIK